MKLQVKLALYNALSKALIILAISAVLPVMIEKIVYDHIDRRLSARLDKTLLMVKRGGLNEITLDQDCSFDSYNIFKEEFVSISPLTDMPPNFGKIKVENTERLIENEIVHHRVFSRAFIYDNQLYELEIGEGLSTVDQLNQSLKKFNFSFLVAIILITIFVDLGFARLLLRPFNKIINRKLRNVDHPGSFNFDRIKSSTYEFDYLDRSINEMMSKIRETFEMEREFILNVSHELLTPISILKNRIENMLNDPAIPLQVAEKMVESQKTLARLTKVVRSLLYISKIENAQFIKNESAQISEVIREILEEVEDWTVAKGITVVSEWKSELNFTPCNRSLLHTMLFNLIANGIKYNKENGKIFITGEEIDGGYLLTIEDTGHGIAKDHLSSIFERFKRFRPQDDMSYGLGLPIVKSIADFHGIEIEVESSLNIGTLFKLHFKNI